MWVSSFHPSKRILTEHSQALARAIYARKRVLFADDIFSGLDTGTRDHVWGHVFGPMGLLRRSHTTVILVTHTGLRHSHLPATMIAATDGDHS